MSRVLLGFIVLAAIFGFWGVSSYNRLVRLDQAVQSQWAQVENVYQRRADLVPNLVQTVNGAANFENETLNDATAARARLQAPPSRAPTDAQSLEQFQQQQDQLGSALSRL